MLNHYEISWIHTCLFVWSYIWPWKWGLERLFPGRIRLWPEERYWNCTHIWKILTVPMTFVFWGVWFFHAPAIPDITGDHGAVPRERGGVPVQRPPTPAIGSSSTFLPLWGRSSLAVLSASVRVLTGCGRWPPCLSAFWDFPFVSTDVCSDVRQLFKGHLRMKSKFYSIRMDSSDFISLVNIYGITPKILQLPEHFLNKDVVNKTF